MTDAICKVFDLDIAFQNNGGIRVNKLPLSITFHDLYTLDPFGNQVVRIDMTTAEIRSLIRNSCERRHDIDLQVAGMSYIVRENGTQQIQEIELLGRTGPPPRGPDLQSGIIELHRQLVSVRAQGSGRTLGSRPPKPSSCTSSAARTCAPTARAAAGHVSEKPRRPPGTEKRRRPSMAQLYFRYSTMNAGKSTEILKIAHNYEEQNKHVLLFTPAIDDRYGRGQITSRMGVPARGADHRRRHGPGGSGPGGEAGLRARRRGPVPDPTRWSA